jgi:hypothetical protein
MFTCWRGRAQVPRFPEGRRDRQPRLTPSPTAPPSNRTGHAGVGIEVECAHRRVRSQLRCFRSGSQSGSHSHVSRSPPHDPGRSDFPSPVPNLGSARHLSEACLPVKSETKELVRMHASSWSFACSLATTQGRPAPRWKLDRTVTKPNEPRRPIPCVSPLHSSASQTCAESPSPKGTSNLPRWS